MIFQSEEERQIAEQVKAIDEQIDRLTEQLEAGSISDRDYKLEVAKLKFQRAQVQERNAIAYEKDKARVLERDRDRFND